MLTLNLMVLNVSTRKYHRAVRPAGSQLVAEIFWSDHQRDGDHVLVAAIGVDGNGDKHVLAVVEGATENTVVVQACSTISSPGGSIRRCPGCSSSMARRRSAKRSATPSVWPPPSSAARSTRAVTSSSACPCICMRASRRRSVRPGTRTTQTRPNGCCATWPGVWSMRNRASRAASWRGWTRILTVIRLGLPHELRRSLACTNIVENALGTVRQVTRNVKRWRHAEMALRWTAAGLLEAQKTFRRLKAYRQLPILRNALQEHLRKAQADSAIETIMKAA